MNRLILVFLIATFAVTLNAAPGEMIKRSPHMPSMPERPNFPQPGEMPPPPPGLPPPPEGMPRPPMPGLSRFVRSPRMPEIPQPSDIPIPVKRFVRSLEEAPISNLNGMVEPLPEATRNIRSQY
ncbi:CLUMA_CG002948, isoform A [Clunio marinus]|uniref:CLUMA_CG002948, isoform A n=1 Tax=Clunio marinus TaxID=568069 RepID=A0A1J1HP66_9DIPT|nr:CLUMA_CG002948, isoform A [Clunio marinus]